MKNQMIMARSLPVEVTNGTLEGDIVPGDITFYRLQSTADNKLRAYIAHGEVLPVATKSFGGIGVFAIPDVSIVMCSSKAIILTMVQLHLATTARLCMKCSNILA